MQNVTQQTFEIGQVVQFHGRSKRYQITKMGESSDYVYFGGSCNAVHVLDIHLVGQKVEKVDREGRSAGQAAKETFSVGKNAIYHIMGDMWLTVKEIKDNGEVTAAHGQNDQEVKKFRASLFDGSWTWVERYSDGYYSLRAGTGAFHEYSD